HLLPFGCFKSHGSGQCLNGCGRANEGQEEYDFDDTFFVSFCLSTPRCSALNGWPNILGAGPISNCVYGCSGLLMSLSVGPCSLISPRYSNNVRSVCPGSEP